MRAFFARVTLLFFAICCRSPLPPRQRRRRLPCDVPWQWTQCGQDGTARFHPRMIPFTGNPGIQVQVPCDASPLDYFQLYMSNDIIDHLVTETNRYASQYTERERENLTNFSNARNWTETTHDEMCAFLGLIMLMGVVHKPRLNMYWSNDDLLNTPIFRDTMPRDRCYLLLKFFHCANNSNRQSGDRLFKIRELVDMIRHRCQTVFYPYQDMCVDESLICFKGRLCFKQYMKSKRSRFGVKIYQVSTCDGIVNDFIIYHGNMNDELVDIDGLLVTERIAVSLLQPYLGHGHRCVKLQVTFGSSAV